MQFVFHTRGEAMEPPHVHVYRGKGPKRDKAKVWLRDLSLAKRPRGFDLRDLREIVEFLEPLQSKLLADWDKEIAIIGK